MKHVIAVFLIIVSLFCFSGCGDVEVNDSKKEKVASHNSKDEKIILRAIDLLEEEWAKIYDEYEVEDRYFEIKNTRVINIQENDIAEFKDVECIVDFSIYSNRRSLSPYYEELGICNSVTVYKNGKMEIPNNNLISKYLSRVFVIEDISEIIESVIDYNDEYNKIVKNLE